MGAWPDTVTARTELRAFLNDGPTDRPAKSKDIIGAVDGTNAQFFTFEERIVPGSIVFSFDGVEQPPAVVASEDDVQGRFIFAAVPTRNIKIRARYYYQYFLDSELDEALRFAAGEIHENTNITTVEPGLAFAAFCYGGYFAYNKQALRWAHRMSEKFLLLEQPIEGEPQARSNLFRQIAVGYLKDANEYRDAFYMRHGRRHAPAFAVFKPRLPLIGPRR